MCRYLVKGGSYLEYINNSYKLIRKEKKQIENWKKQIHPIEKIRKKLEKAPLEVNSQMANLHMKKILHWMCNQGMQNETTMKYLPERLTFKKLAISILTKM